jgi:protein O-mannosyl-transferase
MFQKGKMIKQKRKPLHSIPGDDNFTILKNKNLKIVICLLLVSFFTLYIFYPSINNDFTNWDDPVYVTQDTMIFDLKSENLKQIFEKPISFNYHPLTMLSLAIDYKIAFNKETQSLSARSFHLTNLIFHILNVILIFLFIYLLSGNNIPVAVIVSLLFGIHPLRVESVAWISERKDVLYSFFYILSLIVYLKYLKNRQQKLYFVILFLFICSILSKAMAITLPLIFFIIDYYKGRRFSKNSILEKVPFLILSLIFGIIALKIQSKGGALTSVFGFIDKLSIASYGFTLYLYKLIVPINLSTYYPYPFPVNEFNINIPVWFYIFPLILILFFLLAFIVRNYSKLPLFGFLFYFITIVMVLQFISVGTVIIADRYTYMAYIGLFFIVGGFYNFIDKKSEEYNHNSNFKIYKYLFILVLTIYMIFCSFITRNRLQVWKNSETLWSDVINKYPGEFEAGYLNRAYYYYLKALETKNNDFVDKSIEDYKVLIKMNSKNSFVYSVMGNLTVLKNDPLRAIEYFDRAVQLDSSNYNTLINRALTYFKLNKYDLSIIDIEKVLLIHKQRQPYVLQAYNYFMLDNFERSKILYSNLIIKYPDYFDSYYYRGIAYFKLKQYDLALIDLNHYLTLSNQKTDVIDYINEINKMNNLK